MAPRHPYYPTSLKLPGYQPMVVEFDYILGVFFAAVMTVAASTWLISGKSMALRCGTSRPYSLRIPLPT